MAEGLDNLSTGVEQLVLELSRSDSIDSNDDATWGSHFDDQADAYVYDQWNDPLKVCDVQPLASLKLSELYYQWASQNDAKKNIEKVMESPAAAEVTTLRVNSSYSAAAASTPTSPFQHRRAQQTSDVLTTSRSIPRSPVTSLIRSTVVFPASPQLGSTVADGKGWENQSRSPLAEAPLMAKTLSQFPGFETLDKDFDLGESLTTDSKSQTKQNQVIPPFYFPAGSDYRERESVERELMKSTFENCKVVAGEAILAEKEVVTLLRDVVNLPAFLAEIVFGHCSARNPEESVDEMVIVAKESFFEFYDHNCAGQAVYKRLFNLLRSSIKAQYLTREDLHPIVDLLLVQHPGLAFLEATPQFQLRYLETVVERVFYTCAKRHPSRLYPKELQDEGFLDALFQIDQDEVIDNERRFFSYEHFYVLYCRFWELDTDHDRIIDAEDVLSYGGHALSCRIVDRIFSTACKPKSLSSRPRMDYAEFIWFCMSEEDKTSERALDYWFRCVDLDGDGAITLFDMEFFYEEQVHRMECLGHEPITFKNVVRQLMDMIAPGQGRVCITKDILRRSKLQSNFFNILFNINRLFLLEGKDLRAIRNQRETPELTEWDRFARYEYLRLSAESGETDTAVTTLSF
eukprot:Plantae.Rhodophyta-Purpureofilum_apyrenoidigerum.ctg1572.p1 GENE.Plantae.Rhodophyta-Purpureofilum_apyrenoidigerum.ctg1572~~Plantae.Rhodophyta-Purpureofilum_apyrenoidigerum.ctg1572.p1  ORF type:complete len:630 (+),score=113.37 Plantae.Rhodophyta-Purpureofilum_apyrenoidigerum.ctg1572:1171-3060(+)